MVLPWLIISAALAASGCQGKLTPAPAPLQVELPAGTKIQAMLLKQLESGVDDEGTSVPLAVIEDVKDSAGHVLIPKGTPLQGRVTWSRREGALDGVFGRPARLNLALETTVAADGQPVDICADPEDPKEAYELNRANTGFSGAAGAIDEVAKDERDERVLVAMQQLFENGDARELEAAQASGRLRSIAQRLNIPGLAQGGDVGKIRDLLNQLRTGTSLASLSPAALDGPMTLTSLVEMSKIAHKVNEQLGRAGHGRNIKAYIGTPVTAYVAKSIKVSVK